MAAVAWSLLLLAVVIGLAGKYEAGLFVAIASLAVALFAPTDEQADARRRNPIQQARRVR